MGLRLIVPRVGYPLAGLAVAIVLWQVASWLIGPGTMPGPVRVAEALGENFFESTYLQRIGLMTSGGWADHLIHTTRTVFIGLGIGAFVGISLGVASIPLPALEEIVDTIAVPVVVSPVVVAIPFFLIWFGVVATGQIMIVAFYSTFLLYIYSRRAADNVEPVYAESAMTLGAGKWDVFRSVYLPATVPEIAAGIRVALAGAWGLAAVAELIGSQQGIGFLVRFYQGAFRIEAMLGLVLVLGIVAVVIDRLLVWLIGYITRWSEAGRQLQL